VKTDGWQDEVFLQWLKHFSSFMKHSREDKVLIVHEPSSCKNVNVLSFVKEIDIVMMCLAHTNFNFWMCHFMDN
jgi:hypothetical protein